MFAPASGHRGAQKVSAEQRGVAQVALPIVSLLLLLVSVGNVGREIRACSTVMVILVKRDF